MGLDAQRWINIRQMSANYNWYYVPTTIAQRWIIFLRHKFVCCMFIASCPSDLRRGINLEKSSKIGWVKLHVISMWESWETLNPQHFHNVETTLKMYFIVLIQGRSYVRLESGPRDTPREGATPSHTYPHSALCASVELTGFHLSAYTSQQS